MICHSEAQSISDPSLEYQRLDLMHHCPNDGDDDKVENTDIRDGKVESSLHQFVSPG